MLLKIAIRVAATFATIIGLGVLRLVLFYAVFHNAAHRPAGQRYVSSDPTQQDLPVLPPDHSGWVVFSSTDAASGATIRHARLMEALPNPAPDSADAAPAPPPGPRASLEFLREGLDGRHAVIALRPHSACAGITRITAAFDNHAPHGFDVKPAPQGALCARDVIDYDAFLQEVRDSDTATVRDAPAKPAAAATYFAVGGLSWD